MSTFDKYCMYIKTTQTTPIRNMLDPIKAYFPEMCLKIGPQGIRAFEMDSIKSALLHLQLSQNSFEIFHCPNEILLGVNILSLAKIFKNMDNEDVLVLYVKKDTSDKLSSDKLYIEITRAECNKKSTIELKLMDLSLTDPPSHEITFNSVIRMSSGELQKLCREFKDYSEDIQIINIKNQLIFKCANDRFKYERRIGQSENGGIQIITHEKPEDIVSGTFKAEYLVEFTKCANLSKVVELHLQNNFPLILKYHVGTLGEIRLGIAPKVSDIIN